MRTLEKEPITCRVCGRESKCPSCHFYLPTIDWKDRLGICNKCVKPLSMRVGEAGGLGDAICGAYVAAGAARAGYSVNYHTFHPDWLKRLREPEVKITKYHNANGGILDVSHNYNSHLRFNYHRKTWYASRISPEVEPVAPNVDTSISEIRLPFENYVLLSPFSAWKPREWPTTHWTLLTQLLIDAGFEVVGIGRTGDEARLKQIFEHTAGKYYWGHDSDWVTDVILGSKALIGNDSGLAHVGGFLNHPTVALHSHLEHDFLFSHTRIVSLSPETSCTFCRWQPERGYKPICDAGCSALATVRPDVVVSTVQEVINASDI